MLISIRNRQFFKKKKKKKEEHFLPLPSLAFSIAFVAILHSCNSGDGIKPAGEFK
jgi:hypothetical protein